MTRVRDRVRISLRLTLILILTLNNDYTTLLISRLYCNIYKLYLVASVRGFSFCAVALRMLRIVNDFGFSS